MNTLRKAILAQDKIIILRASGFSFSIKEIRWRQRAADYCEFITNNNGQTPHCINKEQDSLLSNIQSNLATWRSMQSGALRSNSLTLEQQGILSDIEVISLKWKEAIKNNISMDVRHCIDSMFKVRARALQIILR